MAEQLVFSLPVETAFARDDFFVTEANRLAVIALENWRDWPHNKLILCGPKGAGKSHLVHIWAEQAGARVVQASALGQADIQDLVTGPICVEDVPRIAENADAQAALFHLYNLATELNQSVLFTGVGAVSDWDMGLPDLLSRLMAVNAVVLNEPDDGLLSAVLVKLFSDRQLQVDPSLIPYVLLRMERSFGGGWKAGGRVRCPVFAIAQKSDQTNGRSRVG